MVDHKMGRESLALTKRDQQKRLLAARLAAEAFGVRCTPGERLQAALWFGDVAAKGIATKQQIGRFIKTSKRLGDEKIAALAERAGVDAEWILNGPSSPSARFTPSGGSFRPPCNFPKWLLPFYEDQERAQKARRDFYGHLMFGLAAEVAEAAAIAQAVGAPTMKEHSPAWYEQRIAIAVAKQTAV